MASLRDGSKVGSGRNCIATPHKYSQLTSCCPLKLPDPLAAKGLLVRGRANLLPPSKP